MGRTRQINNTQLYPFQEQAIDSIDDFEGRSLLALDMGLGKTLIALHYLERNPDTFPAIVVCPASVKYIWEHESIHHIGLRASVLEGTRPSMNGYFVKRSKLTVLNYDILSHWLERLKALNPRTIILDESHYISNRKTKRSKATRELCKGVPYVIALSGTPLTNRPAELWSTLNILRPDLYPSFWNYGHRFCSPKLTPWGWTFRGATNLKELRSKLGSQLMIRYRKEDVLTDLPEKVRQTIPCDLKDREQYEYASSDFLGWLKQHNSARLDGAKKAIALTRVSYLLKLSARLKLRSVVRWVNKFLRETDEKLVLFAVHKKMIEALQRRCKAKSVVIDGSVTGRKRKAAVDQFQHDRKTRLFIGNIRAAGIGITLTAASTVGITELDWVPGNLTQAEDRIHRIGQKKTSWVYYLIAGDTIEERMCEILRQKQKVIRDTLDGGNAPNDFDVFNRLLRTIGRE